MEKKEFNLRMKMFLDKVEYNKWCFNPIARKKIVDFLKECELLPKGYKIRR